MPPDRRYAGVVERRATLLGLVEQIVTAQPPDSLRAVTALRHQLTLVETELVADALRNGTSWSQIGEALLISKQAAHKRHRRPVGALDRAAEAGDGSRAVVVTAEARLAVRLARQEAAAFASASVGTEHLLLGLIRAGDAEVNRVLQHFGVSLARAREVIQPTVEVSLTQARGVLSAGEAEAGAAPQPAISPLARRVVRDALGERLRRATGELGAPDLLEALLRDRNGGAARTLTRLAVDPGAVQAEIAGLQRGSSR